MIKKTILEKRKPYYCDLAFAISNEDNHPFNKNKFSFNTWSTKNWRCTRTT